MKNFPTILLICFILTITLVSAVSIGDTPTTIRGVNMVPPEPGTNFSDVGVNSSDFWDDLDTPADFLWNNIFNSTGDTRWGASSIPDIWVNETGDTMTGDLIFNGLSPPMIFFNDSSPDGDKGEIEYEANVNLARFIFRPRQANGGFPSLFIQQEDIQGTDDLLFLAHSNDLPDSNMVFEHFEGNDFYIQTRDPTDPTDGNILIVPGAGNKRFFKMIQGEGAEFFWNDAGDEVRNLQVVNPGTSVGTSTVVSFKMSSTADIDMGKILANRTNNPGSASTEMSFWLWTGGAVREYMKLLATGEFGIGTSIPTELLHVAGNIFVGGDNLKLLFGGGKDASILYDGINMIINPKEVGSGAVIIPGDLNQTGGNATINNIYGNMWFNNDSSSGRTTIINTINVWENVTGFEQASPDAGQNLNGFTFDLDNVLIPQFNSLYMVKYDVSFERVSGGVGREFEMAIMINGIIQNETITHRSTSNVNDVGSASKTSYLMLDTTTHVHLMVRNTGGSENVGVHSAGVNILRIGD